MDIKWVELDNRDIYIYIYIYILENSFFKNEFLENRLFFMFGNVIKNELEKTFQYLTMS
jgi:hypothetical protein